MTEAFLAATTTSLAELRYLALGDSYTIGEGVEDCARWPAQLARALRADGMAITDPQVIAQTGWTTDELDAAIDAAQLLPGYDLASLLIGVNNQYRGRSVEEYREQFSGLLERAIALAGHQHSRVFVLSIPDWSVTPFAQGRDRARIAQEIDQCHRTPHLQGTRRGLHRHHAHQPRSGR